MSGPTEPESGDRVVATWIYVGRRLAAGGKVYHAFLDDTGEERWFAKTKATVVGGRHEVTCSPDRHTLYGAPRYLNPSDHPDVATWRAEDRAAWLELEASRAMRRAAADNGEFGALTLAEYRVMVRSALPPRRGALLAALLAYLGH